MKNIERRTIDVLKYVGKKPVHTFKCLPLPVDHPERNITLLRDQIIRAGIDISVDAFRFLKRDYRTLIVSYKENVSDVEMFEYELRKLKEGYDLTKEQALKALNTVFSRKYVTPKPKEG